MEWSFVFFLNSVLLGVGLAMDAFSVSMANGLHDPKMTKSTMVKIAGTFGIFQAAMPMIGWVCVHTIVELFSSFESLIPWIALALLGYIGYPYAARMQAMFIFALFPLLALFAQPLGNYSYWYPIIIIGIAGAAHQSWSANIYSVVGDMFPKSTIATIVGIGGMAGGISSYGQYRRKTGRSCFWRE